MLAGLTYIDAFGLVVGLIPVTCGCFGDVSLLAEDDWRFLCILVKRAALCACVAALPPMNASASTCHTVM